MLVQTLLKKDIKRLQTLQKEGLKEHYKFMRALVKGKQQFMLMAKTPEALALSFGGGMASSYLNSNAKISSLPLLFKYSWLLNSATRF